jgi:hypothetical protein
MRWSRFRRWNPILTAALIVWVLAWTLGGLIGLSIPFAVGLVVTLALAGASAALLIVTVRTMRADAVRVVAAHAGSVAFPTGIASWPGSQRGERDSVIAVTADGRGLSFRDHENHEVLLVPAERILSLELTPLVPGSRFRPFRVTTSDGVVIDFSGPVRPDEQVDAVVALRDALGRSS